MVRYLSTCLHSFFHVTTTHSPLLHIVVLTVAVLGPSSCTTRAVAAADASISVPTRSPFVIDGRIRDKLIAVKQQFDSAGHDTAKYAECLDTLESLLVEMEQVYPCEADP